MYVPRPVLAAAFDPDGRTWQTPHPWHSAATALLAPASMAVCGLEPGKRKRSHPHRAHQRWTAVAFRQDGRALASTVLTTQ
jgi:hypothetical protein